MQRIYNGSENNQTFLVGRNASKVTRKAIVTDWCNTNIYRQLLDNNYQKCNAM